jgi:hypothetical protein
MCFHHHFIQGANVVEIKSEYLQDSPITEKTGSDTITITTPKITDSKFTYTGHVRNVRQTAVPLLIYNSWLSEHEYILGQNAIKENVTDFVQNATIQEAVRTGNFYASPNGTSGLSLEIDVDSIHVSGIQQRIFRFHVVLLRI